MVDLRLNYCGDAGHRLEPVGIVGSTLLNGPVLHGICNLICSIQRQLAAGGDTVFPDRKDFFRKAFPHGGFVEYVRAEQLRDIQDFGHNDHPLQIGITQKNAGKNPNQGPNFCAFPYQYHFIVY